MKISTKGRYGLRLMIDLVANSDGHVKVSLHQVAGRQDISEKYLWQIANSLKTAGLISAIPGAKGGFILNKKPEDISLADILEAVEGKLALAPCVKTSDVCSRSVACVARDVWKDLNSKLNDVFKSVSLKDVVEKQSNMMAGAPLVYNI